MLDQTRAFIVDYSRLFRLAVVQIQSVLRVCKLNNELMRTIDSARLNAAMERAIH